ncbi:MAG: pyridoxal-phosphate dependent enzyme [Paramuribaculum sp.]|nr:pyridoxal-phosphate dependent enzyme [Paramuribaculum sp.]
MKYFSSDNYNHVVSLYDAVTTSIAPGGGVYMPVSLPYIPTALFNNISDMSLQEIAYVVGTSLFGSDIPAETINDIVKDTLSFDIPLVKIKPGIYSLELFHGPTKSFKDIGARFMARLLQYFSQSGSDNKTLNVIVTTTGNTGSAVANAFAGLESVNVFVLTPKTDSLQKSALDIPPSATNIIPVEVRSDYDTCVKITHKAYLDKELNRAISLTTANSLNIARLLPQTFFFFHAYSRLLSENVDARKIAISTPCGNLGNLTAALYATLMGLPISRIMATGRGNERLWGHIRRGKLSLNEFNSNALATNLSRINHIMTDSPHISTMVDCHTLSNDEVESEIRNTYHNYGYLLDRNSAMASHSLVNNIRKDETGVFLATSHPMKHREDLENILGERISVNSLDYAEDIANPPRRHRIQLSPTLPALKKLILEYNNTTL